MGQTGDWTGLGQIKLGRKPGEGKGRGQFGHGKCAERPQLLERTQTRLFLLCFYVSTPTEEKSQKQVATSDGYVEGGDKTGRDTFSMLVAFAPVSATKVLGRRTIHPCLLFDSAGSDPPFATMPIDRKLERQPKAEGNGEKFNNDLLY